MHTDMEKRNIKYVIYCFMALCIYLYIYIYIYIHMCIYICIMYLYNSIDTMHICMYVHNACTSVQKTCGDYHPIRPEQSPQPGSTAGSAGSWHGQNVMLWPSFSWFEGKVTAVLPSQLWFPVNCPFSRAFVLTIHCFLVESLWVSWVFVWLVNFTLVWSELY